MADGKLIFDAEIDQNSLQQSVDSANVQLGTDGKGAGDTQNKLDGILGGIGKIATLAAALLNLKVIRQVLQLIFDLANFGLIKLIQFVGDVGKFLSTLPSTLLEIGGEIVGNLTNALKGILPSINIFGGGGGPGFFNASQPFSNQDTAGTFGFQNSAADQLLNRIGLDIRVNAEEGLGVTIGDENERRGFTLFGS